MTKSDPQRHVINFLRRLARALQRRLGNSVGFLRYRKNFESYRRLLPGDGRAAGKVLFVVGRGMNIGWAQIWTYLSKAFALKSIEPCVVMFKKQRLLRLYFGLARAKVFWHEEVLPRKPGHFDANLIAECMTVSDWKRLHYRNMPVGQMALSTYCRHHATGLIDPSQEALKKFSEQWIRGICQAFDSAKELYEEEGITTVVFSETFIEEYGGYYYAALDLSLDVIKTSGTVRDDAILVQRRTKANERLHHAALSDTAWSEILRLNDFEKMEKEVESNFLERYGHKWFRSSRNHKDARIVSRREGRRLLNISEDRKVVVVFSHILYDALFHYGDELFQDYATWLIETIKAAIENPNVDWFIKLHPSNMWRGEFQTVLGGRYEEEKIVSRYVGTLPSHIKFIYADTEISPYGWYQIADYGISVRGTAGLEMACLGKPVITAGTGRYEGKGFTVDPRSIEEYREILLSLPALRSLTREQTRLAIRYAYGLFNMKPFTLSGLEPRIRFGQKEVLESDDITYIPKVLGPDGPPSFELTCFADFVVHKEQVDLLTKY
jgi:hypothetical protein